MTAHTGEDTEQTLLRCSWLECQMIPDCQRLAGNSDQLVKLGESAAVVHYRRLGGSNSVSFWQLWRLRGSWWGGQHAMSQRGHFLAYTQLTTCCWIPTWRGERACTFCIFLLKSHPSFPLWPCDIKHNWKQLGQERVYFCLQLIKPMVKGSQCRKSRAAYWFAPCDCQKFAFFFFFLNPLGSTCPVLTPPTMGRALPYQSTIKKLPHRHGHRPIWYKQFPKLRLSQVTLDCDKVTAETSYDSVPILPLRVPHS